jgi:hypothetical protein
MTGPFSTFSTGARLSCACVLALAVQRDALLAQTVALPCPGPATEGALIAAARAGNSDDRLTEWVTSCGVPFPLGIEALQRLVAGGVSQQVAGAAVPGRYFYLISHPSDDNIAGILNTPAGSVLRSLTAAEKAGLVSILSEPDVAAIRTLLDRYLTARASMTSAEDQRRAGLLDKLPPEVLKSRFLVLVVNPYIGGGQVVTILFTHASHPVLDVHVTTGEVSFLRLKALPVEAHQRLAEYYGALLNDADYLR